MRYYYNYLNKSLSFNGKSDNNNNNTVMSIDFVHINNQQIKQ